MSEQNSTSTATGDNERCLHKITAKPSNVIKHFERILDVNGVSVYLTLITMKRSILLVINNASSGGMSTLEKVKEDNDLSTDDMIRGFMSSNSTLKGLCLAIGDISTCMINSDNSLNSATLATRLSKKLNKNNPVYVANNFLLSHDTVDSDGFTAKLYLKIFQFVSANYKCLKDN